jgi:hypothetical protein
MFWFNWRMAMETGAAFSTIRQLPSWIGTETWFGNGDPKLPAAPHFKITTSRAYQTGIRC